MPFTATCKRLLAKCLKLLSMDILRWPLLVCLVVSFSLLALSLTVIEGAPAAGEDDMAATTAAMPQPPADAENMQNDSPLRDTTPSPVQIPFLKSSRCKLYSKDEHRTRTSRVCGMRELDLPDSSGVLYWKPHVCRYSHCQCVATKEVFRREKRIAADNRTDIGFRRFRVFECA